MAVAPTTMRGTMGATGALVVRRTRTPGEWFSRVVLYLVLIVGAMLFGRSLRNLATVDPGFRPDGIVAVGVDLRRSSIDPAALQQVQNQALERVKGIPGVIAAAEAFIVPMSGSGWNQNIVIDGVEKDGSVNMNRIGGDGVHADQLLPRRTGDRAITFD